MTYVRQSSIAVLLAGFLAWGAGRASGQTFLMNARDVAMGGVGAEPNIALDMVPSPAAGRTIALPLGLARIFTGLDRFNPGSSKFDPLSAVEDAANPFYLIFGPAHSSNEQQLLSDLLVGRVSRDLNDYHGFRPRSTFRADGLAIPTVGGTIKFRRQADGAYQGIYVGLGAFIGFTSDLSLDDHIVQTLAATTPIYFPNSTLHLGEDLSLQFGWAGTVGYRGRFTFPGANGPLDGVYLAANLRGLAGVRYVNPNLQATVETDAGGLLTLNAPATPPLLIDNGVSHNGVGHLVDVGVEILRHPWQFGVGINRIGNRISWNAVSHTQYSLADLLTSPSLVSAVVSGPDHIVSVFPIVVTANAGFSARQFTVLGDVTHEADRLSVHGGGEFRVLPFVAVRAGVSFSRDKWNRSVGFGLGGRVSFDVAYFTTTSNLPGERRQGLAASIHIGPKPIKAIDRH